MKPNRVLLAAVLGITPVLAMGPSGSNERAEVNFFEPEKFTDVRGSYMDTDVHRTGYLEQLRDHILTQVQRIVPSGLHLAVTFTDIDMAGDFEPWLGPRWDDVRIVKDIYPPRINLSFRVVDADGNIVKQGRRELRDLAFLMKITLGSQQDTLRHEKALIDDWLRAEFPRVSKR